MRQTETTLSRSDERLLSLIKRNDISAFNVVYEKYWDPLNHFASHYIRDNDTCKEIVQDLFIHLYIKRTELNIQFSLSSYLQTSLHHKILNYLRSRSVYKRHVQTASERSGTMDNNAQYLVDQSDLEKNIGKYISSLPAKYQEVYFLYRQKGFKVKEMAAILGRPANTVDKQLRRILSLLRSYLRDYR